MSEEQKPDPTVVIDPKTTRASWATVATIIAASFFAWRQVSNLEQGLLGVRQGLGVLSDDLKEVKHTLDRQGSSLTQGALSAARMEIRLESLEKRVQELERDK